MSKKIIKEYLDMGSNWQSQESRYRSRCYQANMLLNEEPRQSRRAPCMLRPSLQMLADLIFSAFALILMLLEHDFINAASFSNDPAYIAKLDE